MGLYVCAIDVDDAKLALATKLGADAVVNAKTSGTPVADVTKATGGGAHGVLITAPSLPAFKQGIEMTRKRGTCVLVGLPPGEGKVRADIELEPLASINSVFDRLKHGAVAGRVVIDYAAVAPVRPDALVGAASG
jgi:propanol-preferring alcohol dehydrogenase